MPVLDTRIDPRSPEVRANADAMAGLVADLRRLAGTIRQGGGERARQRHLSRGKLLPRDRIRALVDPLSPFLEIGQLAAHGVYDEDIHEGNWLGARHSFPSTGRLWHCLRGRVSQLSCWGEGGAPQALWIQPPRMKAC